MISTPLLYVFLIPIFGIAVPFYIVHKHVGFRFIPIVVGGSLFFITLIIQPPLQIAPRDLLLELFNEYVYMFYASIISGFVQELLKIVAILKLYNDVRGIWVGFGFGSFEALLIFSNTAIAIYSGYDVDVYEIIMGSYERLIATAFHISSAIIFIYSIWNVLFRYLLMSVYHAMLNFLAIIIIGKDILSIMTTPTGLIAGYAILTLFVAPLFFISYRMVRSWLKADI